MGMGVSEQSQKETDPAPAMGVLRPLLRYLSRGKIPAWAVLLWNALLFYPDWKSRIDVYIDTARGMGGAMAQVASAITSPWFTPAATIAAVLWILFMGEPRRGVVRHPRWAVIGWIAAGAFFTAIAATVLWGAGELYIRSEIAKGIAGVPRGASPAEKIPVKPQRPLHFGVNQTLQPDQLRLLKDEIPKIQDILHDMSIAIAPPAAGPRIDFNAFQMIFARSGVDPTVSGIVLRGPDDQGLIIFVNDLNGTPHSAQKFAEVLTMADVKYVMRADPKFPGVSATHWVLFFGPVPFD